jgi:hypothetical protein
MSIIRNLPADVAAYLKNPKGFEMAFMKALKTAGLVFDTSKTLAQVTRFDKKDVTQVRTTFFDGQSTFPLQSNVQGSVKPNSEHDLYYAIRVQVAELEEAGTPLKGIFQPGPSLTGPELVNGVFNLSVNGVSQLVNVPIADFLGFQSNITQMESGIYFLSSPIWWPGQTSVRCEVQLDAVPSTPTALMVEFIGVGLVS